MELKNVLLTVLLLIQVSLYSQIDTLNLIDDVYLKSRILSNSILTGDYDKLIDLTHPKIVEMTGGREKMKSIIEQGLGSNFEIISNELEKPEKLIISDSIIQCSLKQRQEFKMDNNKYYTIGYLIGISYDSGGTWYFISVSGNTLTTIRTHFPELSEELNVCSQSNPILIND